MEIPVINMVRKTVERIKKNNEAIKKVGLLATDGTLYTGIYKHECEELGIELIKADRFYPSSKTCSHCGCINKGLKLSYRTFVCPDCGFVIDRDYNAAINLMNYSNSL